MIGNDIVDLSVVRRSPRAHLPRFLAKVLTKEEQTWLDQQADRELALWSCWALKESAYKVHFQQYGRRFFAPKKLKSHHFTQKGQSLHAQVQTPNGNLSAIVIYQSEYLHSICATSTEICQAAKTGCFTLVAAQPSGQSQEVRKKVVLDLAASTQIAESTFTWKKNTAIPELYTGTRRFPLSLSHHGRWGAYALLNSTP